MDDQGTAGGMIPYLPVEQSPAEGSGLYFILCIWVHGYRRADAMGITALLWKPFAADARAPKWIRPRKKPRCEEGKVTVTGLINGWCPAMNMVHERARRAAAELGPPVEFREVRTDDRAVFLEWGMNDALFIDGREVRNGPPPKYEKIKKKITRRMKKVKKSGE